MFSACCSFQLICLCFTYALAVSVNRHAKCAFDVDEGNCQEQVLRWFYNSKTGHCETFVYSGCGGNANNFNSTMYCLLACNGTEADTHKYSITSDQTDQLKNGKEGKDQTDPLTKKSSHETKQVNRRKRSNDSPKSSTKQRTPNQKGMENESKNANDIQEILSQLSRSVNLLERIVHNKVGKTPKRPSGKKQRRQKSSPPTASSETLVSKQLKAQEEEDQQLRSPPKAIEINDHSEHSSKTNVDEDDANEFNVEERNMLDAKIKSIIGDPSFVFSYRNISARDMSVLKEALFAMDTKALRLVAPSSQEGGDNGDKEDAGNGQGGTTVLEVKVADEKTPMTKDLPGKEI